MASKRGNGKSRKTTNGQGASHTQSELPPELVLKLACLRATKRSLETGAYQKKLLALFAPYNLVEAFRSAYRGVKADDTSARRDMFQAYGVLQTKNGVSIVNNIMTDNRSVSVEADTDGLPVSFEAAARMLKAERERRGIAGPRLVDATFVPTPEDAPKND